MAHVDSPFPPKLLLATPLCGCAHAESLLDASASCASGLCCVDVDGGSGPSTTASRWIHFEWRRHSREMATSQQWRCNRTMRTTREVERGQCAGGGGEATLQTGGRSPQRTFGFGCARVTYMLLKIHVNAGISRLICTTCATCAGSRERAAWSCPLHLLHRRRAPRATALEGARRPLRVRRAPRATALKGAQRLLRVRRAPRATALEGGRGGRRGPRVDARVHHQPSEASGQQKRHAHAVSRAWLTRGE